MSAPYILVVDDDQNMASIVCAQLRAMGFEADAALDGINAAARIARRKPDLIVMDFQMPGGTGGTVYQRLRLSTHTKDIPIVFLSALPQEQVRKAIPDFLNVGFLSKPCSASELKALVTGLLRPPP
ncbi:MAG: response regulator [Elusimicrobia bacterium]|nr:response regulator [Elusimicrobiota bacterium]